MINNRETLIFFFAVSKPVISVFKTGTPFIPCFFFKIKLQYVNVSNTDKRWHDRGLFLTADTLV